MLEKSTFGHGNAIGEGKDSSNRYIILSPEGYNPKQIRLINIKYRIEKYGDSPRAQSWLEKSKQDEYHYCTSADFEETP